MAVVRTCIVGVSSKCSMSCIKGRIQDFHEEPALWWQWNYRGCPPLTCPLMAVVRTTVGVSWIHSAGCPVKKGLIENFHQKPTNWWQWYYRWFPPLTIPLMAVVRTTAVGICLQCSMSCVKCITEDFHHYHTLWWQLWELMMWVLMFTVQVLLKKCLFADLPTSHPNLLPTITSSYLGTTADNC